MAVLLVLPGVTIASPSAAPDTPYFAQNWAITRVLTDLGDMTQEAVAGLIAPKVPQELAVPAPLTDTQRWKWFLYQYSLSQGLSIGEWQALDRIVYCESRWRQYDANGEVLFGRIDKRDTGLGQINTYFQRKRIRNSVLDPMEPYDNLRLIVYIYKLDGLSPWVCSSL